MPLSKSKFLQLIPYYFALQIGSNNGCLPPNSPIRSPVPISEICRYNRYNRYRSDDRDNTSPDTDENYKWRDYGHNVANTILARHRNATKIICVNDVYDSTYSTKDDERILREKGLGNIPNEHYKPDGNFPSRTKFNKILRKPDNKIRLQKFILKALKEKVVQSEKKL